MRRTLILVLAGTLLLAAGAWFAAHPRGADPRTLALETGPAPAAEPAERAPALEVEARAARHEPAAPPPRRITSAPEPITGPRATLEVLCLNARDGRPLPGLAIHVRSEVEEQETPAAAPEPTRIRSQRNWRPVTDPYACPKGDVQGRVSLAVPAGPRLTVGLAAGNVTMRCEHVHCAPLAEGEERLVRLAVELANDTLFRARVEDAANGDPLAGVGIGRHERSQTESLATTGNDGRFEIPATSWTTMELLLEKQDYVDQRFVLDLAQEEPLAERVFRLVRGASVSGHLLDEQGGPVQMSSLRLWNEDAFEARSFCDARGAFEIDGLPPGIEFQVDLERWRKPVQSADPVGPLASGEARRLELRLAPACKLEGRVVDEEGRLVPGASLWVLRVPRDGLPCGSGRFRGEVDQRTSSDADGHFAFAGLQPGRWGIALGGRDALPTVPRVVTVPLAPPGTLELQHFQHASIRGRVLDTDGNPAVGATVVFALDGCDARHTVDTDPDGSFRQAVHGPWTYRLHAPGRGRALDSPAVSAQAGDWDVVLRLERAAELEVHVRGPGGTPAAGAEVCGLSLADAHTPTAFRFQTGPGGDGSLALPPGRYRFLARDAQARWSALETVDVPASGGAVVRTLETGEPARVRVESSGYASGLEFRVLLEGIEVWDGILTPTSASDLALPAGELVIEHRLAGSVAAHRRATCSARAGESSRVVLAR